MTRRARLVVTWAMVLAIAGVFGLDVAGGGLGLPTGRSALLAAPAAAPDNSITLQPFLSGLTDPIFITHAGDGTGRLFVAQQTGQIMVVVNGQVLPTPFLDIASRVRAGGEQGLLGLAFHPGYEADGVGKGRFFVFYTADGGSPAGNNTLEEYAVSGGNPNVANPSPVRTLLSIPDQYTNHNGGMIAFGPDGKLYVGTGDEGGGGDPEENAQNLGSLYGKLLRLDVDTPGNPEPPGSGYSIPAGNPYVGQADARPEIWALGFRNPWRWSFDRLSGDIFVGDVGQGSWEEIDRLPGGQGGLNLGWDVREGAHCHEPASGCPTTGLTDPILEYSRSSNGSGCASITGGYRYRGAANPQLQGVYFYADFCSGRIWKGIESGGAWSPVEALDTMHNISAFGEDEAGELYVITLGGSVFRIVQTAPIATPTATGVPLDCTDRPRVALQTIQAGPGTLDVTVTSTENADVMPNALQSIAFTRIENAAVMIGSQVNQRSAFTFPLPGGAQSTRFTVRRDQPDRAMMVTLAVTDRCGPWPTFVGAGPALP